MGILVVNAGSTSLKFALFDAAAEAELLNGVIEWPHGERQRAQLRLRTPGRAERQETVSVPDDAAAARMAVTLVTAERPVECVGHRVVYGGTVFAGSRRIDSEVKMAIDRLATLAPLHNPPALAAIEAVEQVLPDVPQVAVFDTAFFAELPPRAFIYPLPYEWYERFGVRRIGFHGLSNQYCAARAAAWLGQARNDLRLITCHLGGGCSATAVRGGKPVATTMGFTPLEGLMMGSRCGSVDPGLLLHLLRTNAVSLAELDEGLNRRSGLLGVSGISADLAQIEAAAAAGQPRAQLAFELFADRVRQAIGALAVTLGGVDALLFTDRIGEGSPALRATVGAGLECLGIRLDAALNATCVPEADIATTDSATRVLVLRTREEQVIAQETRRAICGDDRSGT